MELACGEARWLILDDVHVPALGSEADSFDYGGLDRFALDESNIALPMVGRQAVDVWERRGQAIDAALQLDDLRISPGNRLEALRGDRKGQHSVRVNNQWLICLHGAMARPGMSRSTTTIEE